MRLEIHIVWLEKEEPTCRQPGKKERLIPLEAQVFLVIHTKNPHSVLTRDFFLIRLTGGRKEQIFTPKTPILFDVTAAKKKTVCLQIRYYLYIKIRK